MQIDLRSVRITLGRRTILNGARATFRSGECVALMGPSGSGKTTALGAIAGYVHLDGGEIVHHGEALLDPQPQWIVQSSPLLTRRTAFDNVALGPLSRGKTKAQAASLATEALATLGIDHLATQKVRNLSGGERQRAAVARAMAAQSSIILADEPTASLDAMSRDDVTNALVSASTHGALVVIATHDPAVSARCSRVLQVSDGQLVEIS